MAFAVPAGIDFFVAKCVRTYTGVKAMGVEGVAWVIIALVFLSIWPYADAGAVPNPARFLDVVNAFYGEFRAAVNGHSRHHWPTFSEWIALIHRKINNTLEIIAKRSAPIIRQGRSAILNPISATILRRFVFAKFIWKFE